MELRTKLLEAVGYTSVSAEALRAAVGGHSIVYDQKQKGGVGRRLS